LTLALWLLQDRSKLEAILGSSSSHPVVLATALGVAFLLGAAHALTPGHGKSIVAAYLVGSRGRVSDAIYLGGVVTLTHTASVFVLGLATLYASEWVSLDRIYPWLALLSGVLVTAIGAWLFWLRLRARGHGHARADGGHAHDHSHSHETRPGKASLLSLGISGGLVPCPEALVVLMISISLRRIGLGLAVLVSFSLGLALILISIGIAMVLAAPAMKKVTGESIWIRALPVVSAAVVTVLGVAIVAQATKGL
jgi:nickel/cobalt exporter